MSAKEWLTSATDLLKAKTPDVTPVTSACRKTYDASRDATVNVTRVVVTKARDMHEVLSDDHVRGNITHVAKNVTLNGALYVVRSYGGGPIIDIVYRSVHNGKVESQRLKNLEDKVAKLEKELSSRKTSEQSEIPPINTISDSPSSLDQPGASADHRPENVLQNFMVIPGAGKLERENLAPKKQIENPNDCTNSSRCGSQYRRSTTSKL